MNFCCWLFHKQLASRGASRMRAGQGIWILRYGILGYFRPLWGIFGENGLFEDNFLFEGSGCIPLPPRCAPGPVRVCIILDPCATNSHKVFSIFLIKALWRILKSVFEVHNLNQNKQQEVKKVLCSWYLMDWNFTISFLLWKDTFFANLLISKSTSCYFYFTRIRSELDLFP